MTMPFRESLQAAAQSVWEAIFAHAFLKELGDGSLDRQRFLFFVRQDALYLQDFARAPMFRRCQSRFHGHARYVCRPCCDCGPG